MALIAGGIAWSKWKESGKNLDATKTAGAKGKRECGKGEAEGWLADSQRILADRNAGEARIQQGLAEEQKTRAEQQAHEARLAFSKALANQAQSVKKLSAVSLLLAVEALQITSRAHELRVPAAEEALLNALASSGGHVLGGFREAGEDVGISRNNHWLMEQADQCSPLDLTTTDPAVPPRVFEGGGNLSASARTTTGW